MPWRTRFWKITKNSEYKGADMPLFHWNDSYSVKVEEFDSQHKRLVGLVNQLYDAMKEGKGRVVLSDIFDELIKYTVFHFQAEEKLMMAHNYQKTNEHIAAHLDLTKQALALQEKFKSGNMFVTIDVLNFLKDWLAKHILGMDKEYSAFFNAKGIK
jgi:hemerythrin